MVTLLNMKRLNKIMKKYFNILSIVALIAMAFFGIISLKTGSLQLLPLFLYYALLYLLQNHHSAVKGVNIVTTLDIVRRITLC